MELRSGRDKVGEVVLFTIAQNVYGPDHNLLLKKGDVARGHVTTSTKHGSVGRSGNLSFTCDYALAEDGSRVPLLLSVTPSPDSSYSETEGGGSLGEVSASVSTGTTGYGAYPLRGDDPSGYVQSAVPGGYYYQRIGTVGRVVFDPVRLFGDGADVVVDRGQQYDATLPFQADISAPHSAQTPPAAQASPRVTP